MHIHEAPPMTLPSAQSDGSTSGKVTNTILSQEGHQLPMGNPTWKESIQVSLQKRDSPFQGQNQPTVARRPDILKAKENVEIQPNSRINSCLYPNLASSASSGLENCPSIVSSPIISSRASHSNGTLYALISVSSGSPHIR
jgi:hypothetical protein